MYCGLKVCSSVFLVGGWVFDFLKSDFDFEIRIYLRILVKYRRSVWEVVGMFEFVCFIDVDVISFRVVFLV